MLPSSRSALSFHCLAVHLRHHLHGRMASCASAQGRILRERCLAAVWWRQGGWPFKAQAWRTLNVQGCRSFDVQCRWSFDVQGWLPLDVQRRRQRSFDVNPHQLSRVPPSCAWLRALSIDMFTLHPAKPCIISFRKPPLKNVGLGVHGHLLPLHLLASLSLLLLPLKMATNLMMMMMVVPTFLLELQRSLCETLSVFQTATRLTVLRVREAALLQTKTILTMMLARRGLGELLLLMLLLFEAESVSKLRRL